MEGARGVRGQNLHIFVTSLPKQGKYPFMYLKYHIDYEETPHTTNLFDQPSFLIICSIISKAIKFIESHLKHKYILYM